jgi:DNA-binding transcriptional ArsR family regulator
MTSAGVKVRTPRAPEKPAVPGPISEKTLKYLSQIIQMLGDESRLKILMALAHNGEMNVSALCDLVASSQPAVSHHLRLLRIKGLVNYRRDGKHNYYRVDAAFVRDLLEQVFCDAGNNTHQIEFADFCVAYRRK